MDEPRMSDVGPSPVRALRAPSYFTHHTAVLVCLAEQSGVRLREVAARMGLTERAVTQLVADLVNAGVVVRQREGRRNRYAVDHEKIVPAALGLTVTVGALLTLLGLKAQIT